MQQNLPYFTFHLKTKQPKTNRKSTLVAAAGFRASLHRLRTDQITFCSATYNSD